jgi:hypothetical protein
MAGPEREIAENPEEKERWKGHPDRGSIPPTDPPQGLVSHGERIAVGGQKWDEAPGPSWSEPEERGWPEVEG